MSEFPLTYPAQNGEVRVTPTLDGRAVSIDFYGTRGGLVAGASLAPGMATSLGEALRLADEEALGLNAAFSEVEDDLWGETAVPWLGTR